MKTNEWITMFREYFLQHIDFCAMKSGYYLDNVYTIPGLLTTQDKLDIFEKRLRADTDDEKAGINSVQSSTTACALSLTVQDIANIKPLIFSCEPSKKKGQHYIHSSPVTEDDIYRIVVGGCVDRMKWITLKLCDGTNAANHGVWFWITHINNIKRCLFDSTVGVKIPKQSQEPEIIDEGTYTITNEGNLNVNVVLDYKYTNMIYLCDSKDNVIGTIDIGKENKRYFTCMAVMAQGSDGFQIKVKSAEKFWPTTLLFKNKSRHITIPPLSK